MSWFKLDDQFGTHPKVLRAGHEASWLFVCGGLYCSKHLTDGLIPKEAVGTLTTLRHPEKLAAKLVEVGLWRDTGPDYEVHDYLVYNPSREKVENERRAAIERRAKGGRRSADVRANAMNPDPARPDVLAERGLDPPNPHSVGAQRSRVNGTNPRTLGTNPRAANVDAVLGEGIVSGCRLRVLDCVNGWVDTGAGYETRCDCNTEEATA